MEATGRRRVGPTGRRPKDTRARPQGAQTCITVCAKDALKVSMGLDLGWKERLRRGSEKTAA
jgi:hypothetical protein